MTTLEPDTHSNDLPEIKRLCIKIEELESKIETLTHTVEKLLLLIEEDPSRIQNRMIRMKIPSPFFPHFINNN